MADLAQGDNIADGAHGYSSESTWVEPEDRLVKQKLEWFRDQKLGLMIHWGIYSQLGIIESWPLSDEDADWSRKDCGWEADNEAFRQQYFALNQSFNPVRFQPESWAEIAKENGFKYLIFTTKHHDGFCLWDTAATEYKVTGQDCPFHRHRYADVSKHLFREFRRRGLGIAAYFSKPDWHSPYYWAPGFARSEMNRNPTYDPRQNPRLWEEFVAYTHRQMIELVEDYGDIDVLWLDGGQVRPDNGQDIRMETIVPKLRQRQPGLVVVDRTVGGPYENYITPEQIVPSRPLRVPWESCITMGTSFSFRYDDHYKPTRELIHLLIDIVCKGGNLALNVGPQPDGRWPKPVLDRVREMGAWLNTYGEAVYGTRVCPPYKQDGIAFTRKGNRAYAFLLYPSAAAAVSEQVFLPFTETVKSVHLLGVTEGLAFQQDSAGVTLQMPAEECQEAPIAHVFSLST